jgi:hypothetical protein
MLNIVENAAKSYDCQENSEKENKKLENKCKHVAEATNGVTNMLSRL